MSVVEIRRLSELEAVVERGLATFVEVGTALMEIRDSRLYRESHKTFEAYCLERWGFTPQHGRRLIRAAEVVGALEPQGSIPTLEHTRALAPLLSEPEKLRGAWEEAAGNGTPSALQVREAVARVLPPVSEEAREKQRRWAATMNALDGLAHFDRPAIREQAEVEAALIDQTAAASRGQIVTPERLRNASAWASLLADALERRGV